MIASTPKCPGSYCTCCSLQYIPHHLFLLRLRILSSSLIPRPPPSFSSLHMWESLGTRLTKLKSCEISSQLLSMQFPVLVVLCLHMDDS